MFLTIYGVSRDKELEEVRIANDKLEKANLQISAWQEDVKALNKEMKQHLIIQNVKVKLVNGNRYKVNSVVEYNIQKSVDEEAQHLIAQDIESAYRSRDILKKQLKIKNTNSIKRFMKLKFIKFIFIQRFRLKFELKRWKKYYKKPLI
ncbi:DNA repair protein [Priestia sp. OVL9]|nr:DNA repair protein [Priestia sp. OVL9]